MHTEFTDPQAESAARVAGAVLRAAVGPGRLGVAFSGGVDSSVVLALAVRELGAERVVALLGVSPSLAAEERTAAHGVAAYVGVRVVEVTTREGDMPAYRANGPDRCYHCKNELFARIGADVAAAHGITAVAYGENADDIRRPDRPGSRAAAEHAVLRPLADAGLDKPAVRRIAAALGLPSADKPAAPCLASRIPHFDEVTPEKLARIERAEQALHRMGFPECRVRLHGDVARIEIPVEQIPLLSGTLGETVLTAVRAAGFRSVTVDPAGIRSGAFTLPLVGVRHG
ncbi:ATP-dependent sacrificial sulfur transferase LarE [Yinghuangia sp. ASG 101]|uniref:ATP-dependent sacrificial sulfur transferase LarE n=1 Tax=Yinghuangia sp. ASG 101 TaxID=2896848 RepID=UPI001E2C3194|nr:ATP-dependent sacrificial sulfur transferase LarE [Yinghuangia sp. ASG 101]UGQ10862.1 ATP-dependent sacrificial sulfur transferase LarE [Yinghuangia sp. ASG 101]